MAPKESINYLPVVDDETLTKLEPECLIETFESSDTAMNNPTIAPIAIIPRKALRILQLTFLWIVVCFLSIGISFRLIVASLVCWALYPSFK